MTETDLSDWPTIDGAAFVIGCSKRTIERLAAAKKLEQRLRPQAGSPAVAVYNPDDVSRIASERRLAPPPFVLPANPLKTATNGNGSRPLGTKPNGPDGLARPAADDPIRQFFLTLIRAIQSPPSPSVAETVAETKLMLTIPEAAAVSGFSQAYLRRKCQSGWTGAIKDGAWKIRRKDLEAL